MGSHSSGCATLTLPACEDIHVRGRSSLSIFREAFVRVVCVWFVVLEIVLRDECWFCVVC